MTCPFPSETSPSPWPLPESPTLSEVFSETAYDGAGPAFVMAALTAVRGHGPDPGTVPEKELKTKGETGRRRTAPGGLRGTVLWVQDRTSMKETGRPYLAGPDLLHLAVGRATDVLWAMEQGLGCPALAGVVGEIWGTPAALDFTATKRLALRAEAHGVPAWLIRRAGAPDLSAARLRWRLASAPSARLTDDPRAPGMPRWTADLFRARGQRPAVWTVAHDPARGTLDFVAAPAGVRETVIPEMGAPLAAQAG